MEKNQNHRDMFSVSGNVKIKSKVYYLLKKRQNTCWELVINILYIIFSNL